MFYNVSNRAEQLTEIALWPGEGAILTAKCV